MANRELIERLCRELGPVIGYAREWYEHTGSSSMLSDDHEAKIKAADDVIDDARVWLSEQEHTTEEDYQHFLAYSGLEHSETLRYAYYHGADVGLDKPGGISP